MSSTKPLPWLRLYAEIIDDEKVRLLAFEDRWHYIALLCCKRRGLLDTEDSDALLRRKLTVKLGLAPRELEAMAARVAEVGLIDEQTFQPLGWDERQFQSDSSTDRVRAFRDRKKQVKQEGNVSVTTQDTDAEEEAESKAHVRPTAARFGDFWSAYPKKVGKKPAEAKWRSKKLDALADTLVADVRNRIANDGRWLDGFVPNPLTYLTQERWLDELQPRRGPDGRPAPAAPRQPDASIVLEKSRAQRPASTGTARAALGEIGELVGRRGQAT